MPIRFRLNRMTSAGVVATIIMTAGAAASHSSAAAAAISAVETLVSCATTTACVAGSNTHSGPGVSGTSAAGVGITASGVSGLTATGTTGNAITANASSGYGVLATSRTGLGVKGSSTSYDGVEGVSSTLYGVRGVTTTGPAGVNGVATSTSGVEGDSTSGYGVKAVSSTSDGLYASSSTGPGIYGTSPNGVAISAESDYGDGLDATSEEGGAGVFAKGFNALDGDGIAVQTAQNANIYPIEAFDTAYNQLFYVTGVGDVYYAGSIMRLARTSRGATVRSFTAESASPTVEDTGTAQLINGAAAVRLDPTFAASIDPEASYRVFVTPSADTSGLYVPQKTAAGFVVRECRGGRSTMSFDYRIVATATGHSGQRMGVFTSLRRSALGVRHPMR